MQQIIKNPNAQQIAFVGLGAEYRYKNFVFSNSVLVEQFLFLNLQNNL